MEVFPERPNDLGLNWMNLSPDPPDKNLGIWQDVYITTSGPVALRHPQVVSRMDLPSLETAQLTVSLEVHNANSQPVKGVLKGQIEDIQLEQPVQLGPKESRLAVFTPEQFHQLKISRPRVWWGFNTETYPGPTIPPIESLRKFLPEDKLWPINEYWTVHSDGSPERKELQVHLTRIRKLKTKELAQLTEN